MRGARPGRAALTHLTIELGLTQVALPQQMLEGPRARKRHFLSVGNVSPAPPHQSPSVRHQCHLCRLRLHSTAIALWPSAQLSVRRLSATPELSSLRCDFDSPSRLCSCSA